MERFHDRVVVITGGASGIGEATVMRLAGEGASVVIADLDEGAASRVAKVAAEMTPKSLGIACDVASEDDLVRLTRIVEGEFGRIDVVIGNAGIPEPTAVDRLDTESWDRAFDINVRGDFFLVKHALPLLEKGAGKSIVFTASVAGLVGMGGGQPAYSASKGAVVSLARALALELAPRGIRVNTVCPGWVRTPMLLGFYERSIADEEVRSRALQEAASGQLFGRFAEPEEVAAAIAYLASDDASYVTGVALPVDGGFTATVL